MWWRRRGFFCFWGDFLGTTYLNACAQTRVPWPPRAKKQWPKMISRETQKSELRNRVKQTVREAYTQMQLIYNNDDDATPTVVIHTSFDNYRIPGPYEDSNAWEEKRRLAAIVIQKYSRRKIARLAAHRMRRYAIEKRQVSGRKNFLILRSGQGLGFRNCTSWNNLRFRFYFPRSLDPTDRPLSVGCSVLLTS